MKKISLFLVLASVLGGYFYAKNQPPTPTITTALNPKKMTPTKKTTPPAHEPIIIPLHNLNTPLTLNLLEKFSDIQVGACLVRFKPCYFNLEKTAKWEKNNCLVYKFSESFQIVEIDNNVHQALGTYWFGTEYDSLVESNESKVLSFPRQQTLDEWYISPDLSHNYYQGNCGQIQAYQEQNEQEYVKNLPPKPAPPPYEPQFKTGQCIASPADCSREGESWEPTQCHPFDDVKKIHKVGTRHYQASAWYGYTHDLYNLLGYKESIEFKRLDNQGYHVVDCNKMKKLYPQGNYSELFQRTHNRQPASP